jgi:uncharacterized protein (TIGR00369 family)
LSAESPASGPGALADDGHCFVCGDRNEQGLRMKWTVRGRETFADFTADKRHQGWKDVVHGGLLAAILDEAMTRLVWKLHGSAVTAEMTVRYLAPAAVGEKLTAHGKILDDSKRLVLAEARILKADGTVVARAEGKTLKLKK